MSVNDTTIAAANSRIGTNANPMGVSTQVSGNKGQHNTEFINQLAHNPFALQQLEQQSVFVIGLHHCKELVYEIYNVLQYLQETYGEIKGAFRFPAESYYYYNNTENTTNNKLMYGRRKIIYSSAVLLVIFESIYSARKACGLTTTPMYTSITYDANTINSTIQEQRLSTITENAQNKEKALQQLEHSTQTVSNAGEAPKDNTLSNSISSTTNVILPSSEFVNRRDEELNNQIAPKTTMVPFSSSNMLVPSQTSNNNKNVLLPPHYPTHVNKLTYCSQVIEVGSNRVKIEPASHFALSLSAAERCLQTFIPPENVSSHDPPYKKEREMSLWNSSGTNSTNRSMYDNIYNDSNSDNLLQRDNNIEYNSLYNSNTYNWPNTTKITNQLSSQYVMNGNTKGNGGKTDEAGYFSATSRLWTLFFSPFASSSSSSSSSISAFESCPSLLMSYLVNWSAAKAACKRYEAIVIHDNDILPFAKGLTTENNNKYNESSINNNYKKKILGSRYYGNNIDNNNNNNTCSDKDGVEDKCSAFTSRLLNTRDIWGKPTSNANINKNVNENNRMYKNNSNLEIKNEFTDRVKRASLDFSKNLVYKRARSDANGINNNNNNDGDHVVNTHGAIRDNEFAKSNKLDNNNCNVKTREKIVTFASESNERNTRQRLDGQPFASSITRRDDANLCKDYQHYEEKTIHNLENESILGSVSHKARNAVNYFNSWRHHRKGHNTFDKQTPTNSLERNNNVYNIINNKTGSKVLETNNNISTMYMPDDEFVMKESVQERYFREKYSKPKWLSFSLPWSRSTNEELFTSEGSTLSESENWMGKVAHSVQNGLSSVVKCFALSEEQPLQFDSARGELDSARCNDHSNFINFNYDNNKASANNYASGADVKQFTTPLQNRE